MLGGAANTPIDPNGNTFNKLVAGNVAARSLLIGLENSGISVTVNVNAVGKDPTNPLSTATSSIDFAGRSAVITIYSSALTASGNNQIQTLFQELDHIYYSLGPMFPNVQLPHSASLTLGPSTYSYGLFPVNGALPTSYWGYQHGEIHDDIVRSFGSDLTGALKESLQEANNPPANPEAVALQNRGTILGGSVSFAAPKVSGQFCAKASANDRRSFAEQPLVSEGVVRDF